MKIGMRLDASRKIAIVDHKFLMTWFSFNLKKKRAKGNRRIVNGWINELFCVCYFIF